LSKKAKEGIKKELNGIINNKSGKESTAKEMPDEKEKKQMLYTKRKAKVNNNKIDSTKIE